VLVAWLTCWGWGWAGMSKEVPDSAIMELIDRLGVDHSKGLNFQDFKRILMLFPSRCVCARLALSPALALCVPRKRFSLGIRSGLMPASLRNVSIENVFDYWFRQIIDTGTYQVVQAAPRRCLC